jgi:hypothetical protein
MNDVDPRLGRYEQRFIYPVIGHISEFIFLLFCRTGHYIRSHSVRHKFFLVQSSSSEGLERRREIGLQIPKRFTDRRKMEHILVLVVLRYELWSFVGGLALIISYRLLTGAINIDCLLHSKAPGGGYSPARLQLLLLTLGSAVYYAYQCYSSKKFADVPSQLETALGGSNALYVVRKFLNGQRTDN